MLFPEGKPKTVKRPMSRITAFNFPENFKVSNRYQIVSKLGQGWESEVYKIKETSTGIYRAAKFFLPHRNLQNKSAKYYAKKLHKLRNCSILIQYITQDTIEYENQEVTYLISDFVEGISLDQFLKQLKGQRMSSFQGLHFLHAICVGVETIHVQKDYHGDLHTGNVIVKRFGLNFELKLLDTIHWGNAIKENYQEDIVNLIHMFYEVLGSKKHYSRQPEEIKKIICGLKRSLILKKFKTVAQLKHYVESLSWH